MEKGGLKQCRSPFLIHLLLVVILLLGGRSQADDSRVRGHFKCTNRQYGTSESNEEQATNMYSSKPVETTKMQTTSSETTGSTVREATNMHSSKPVETTPKQITSGDASGSTVREATNLFASKPVDTIPMQTTSGDASGSTVREASKSVETTPMQTTTGDDPSIVIKDCLDVFNAGNTIDGIYTIKPTNWTGDSFDVFCNMTDGGGWTVFQRRVDGSVDFYRNWQSYKEGFGELDHEFWLGNDKLYYLTNQGDYQLRIDMVNSHGASYYAKYNLFRINDESDNYKLSKLGNYSGNADTDGGAPGGYALSSHLNYAFSTFDRDNDIAAGSTNCAATNHGAWWYKSCAESNLNGDYMAADNDKSSIRWLELPGGDYNIKYTEMKIRPV
ncbi:fibrinogen-like protein A [Apostichopus japonicus]|uniref:fibrinogen-like protein A n=1 Tax=Stichopus japonicus TaxID=307972 RepID=UPI003AB566DD